MTSVTQTIWTKNSPETLLKLATRHCLHHKEVFTTSSPDGSCHLKPGLYLPVEICESLFNICEEEQYGRNIDDNFTNIFSDTQNTRLGQVAVEGSPLSDLGMKSLLVHGLRKISISNCDQLTTKTLENINENSDNLICLNIENSYKIFPDFLSSKLDAGPWEDEYDEDDFDSVEESESVYEKRHYILRAPRLKVLSLKDLYIVQGKNYFNILCKALPNLSVLDLSGLAHSQGLQKLKFLLNCPNLVSLVLHNVKEVRHSLSTLRELQKLEHLDISQDEIHCDFDEPTKYLEELVLMLPALKSLDISGTNLATDYRQAGGRSDGTLCDIPGLCRRMDNPLEFLGLYRTQNDEACRRRHIPALVVSGNATEEQLIVAARKYQDRIGVMENIFDDIFSMRQMVTNVEEVLDIVVNNSRKYYQVTKIQFSTVMILHSLLQQIIYERTNSGQDFNVAARKEVIKVVLSIIENHTNDSQLVRNAFTVLWKFNFPYDLMTIFERAVNVLLTTGEMFFDDESNYTQRSSMHMLNNLVCHVYGDQKRTMGLKIIDSMLRIVSNKLSKNLCDDVMELAWSIMWNVTDETPENSERFLNQNGMELFLSCKEKFPQKLDLLKNMMGLLGNVAEVSVCRKQLMTPEFIEEFSFLLDSHKDGIEVSYNACGVLSHIASDGPEAWTIEKPERDHVLERLVRAVTRWDVNSRRNINYRSLGPIISLLSVRHTTECRLWATWAIANLTKFDEEKYCALVEEEGGSEQIQGIMEEILTEVVRHGGATCPVKQKLLELGQRATSNIKEWKKKMISLENSTNAFVLYEANGKFVVSSSE